VTIGRSDEYLAGLVRELCKLSVETEWVEFKKNRAEPNEIGEYLSVLANSAALCGKMHAYLVWGVENDTHELVGTNFVPHALKVGNEGLENWLLRLLSPRIHFRFYSVEVDGHPLVLLEIGQAFLHPVRFRGQEFIRVGSYKKKLRDFPEKERELWRIFDKTSFEVMIAASDQTSDNVLELLDYPAYFELLGHSLPDSKEGILESLKTDKIISPCESGNWNITNMGATLFAKRLEDFRTLKRKAMRVIQYPGNNRVETIKERVGVKGYANGFEGLIGYVNGLLPSNEVIEQALRKTVPMYPELAVRELIANALIHQDFFVTGAGPMVEIFDDRIEISNPGVPLVETQRFVDTPPKSRNETLASLMRRTGICEERGSGWDKVVFQTELYQLPAPLPEAGEGHTCVVMFTPRPLSKMDKVDRVRAVYLHASLRYVNREQLTNASLRERFGIQPKNSATASRLIKEAVESGAIVPYDPDAAPKFMRYVPIWAAPK